MATPCRSLHLQLVLWLTLPAQRHLLLIPENETSKRNDEVAQHDAAPRFAPCNAGPQLRQASNHERSHHLIIIVKIEP